MRNKIILITSLLVVLSFAWAPKVGATTISNIEIGEINGNWLNVKWVTSEVTTAYLFFGESPDKLIYSVGDLNLSRSHSADITGLRKNGEYYFKIVVTNKEGKRTESVLNYFKVDKIYNDNGAIFSDFKKLQTTDTTFSASFLTDEKAKIDFRYGTEKDDLRRSWRNYRLETEHQLTITRLNPSTKYYFEIIARDEDNNLTTYSGDFETKHYFDNQIQIRNLIPLSYGDSPIMPEKAFIAFDSNVLSIADIYYGTEPDRLYKRERITTIPSLKHQIFLTELEADTIYYYKLRLRSDLVKDNYEEPIRTFKTAPLTRDYLNSQFQSGDLVKHRSTTYLLYNNEKLPIYNRNKLQEISKEVKPIKESYLEEYTESSAYWGIFHDGQVVKSKNKNTIYLIDGPYKKPIANWQVFRYLNYTANDIIETDSWSLGNYKTGDTIYHSREVVADNSLNNVLVKSPGGSTVYLIVNNKKLAFFTEDAFKKKGYSFSQLRIVSDSLLKSLSSGQLIL